MSLRNKILAAYGVLVALLIAIFFTGFSQLREVASRLDLIQLGYLPITKTVMSYGNFYHMDESFDVAKLVSNRENQLFIDSVSVNNPRLIESTFRKGLSDARLALRGSSSPRQEQALDQVGVRIDKFLEAQQNFNDVIQETLADIRANRIPSALRRNPKLIEEKRAVRTHLDALSRELDELVRVEIRDLVQQERHAVVLLLGLSLLTIIFVIGIGIGIMAIRGWPASPARAALN